VDARARVARARRGRPLRVELDALAAQRGVARGEEGQELPRAASDVEGAPQRRAAPAELAEQALPAGALERRVLEVVPRLEARRRAARQRVARPRAALLAAVQGEVADVDGAPRARPADGAGVAPLRDERGALAGRALQRRVLAVDR
jgi:hypothetical protein